MYRFHSRKSGSFLLFVAICILTFGFIGNVSAQKVRLRAQITPNCGSTSNLKFADIYADGNIAVQGSYNCRGVFIYDISNPDVPVLASWYNPSPPQQFLEAIVIGNRGYFGSGTLGGDGVHIVDLTNPASPVLLGKVNASNAGFDRIHEMMVFDHEGERYLLENSNTTSTTHLRIINVTNPAVPVLKWNFQSSDQGWVHAMHIRGSKLYLSGFLSSTKIDIYDITNLATQAPVLLGSVAVGGNSNHSAWTSEDGNYLYSCRELFDGDIRVYNVTNPAQPLLVKSIKAAELGLNAIAPHNPVVMGNYLYVAWYQAGIQVFDISNPANPIRTGQYDTFQPAFAPPAEERQLLLDSEPWDIICGSGRLQNQLPNSYEGNWAVYPFLGQNKVLAGDLKNGLLVLDASQIAAPPKNTVSDFDADGKTDFSVYTPASGTWNIERSSNGSSSATNFGLNGDKIVAGDYDGDGKSDIAVWRPSNGVWYVLGSLGGYTAVQFGLNGDVPVPADYDADGKTDMAVWRPSNGAWYVQQSTLGLRILQWGINDDKAFAGDYEGDGKADFAIWRPSNGTWYIMQSSSSLPIFANWGTTGDKPMFADFDGDTRSDVAVYRPSNGIWYILNSRDGSFSGYTFGLAEDLPIPADYDGDAKADVSVFRPSTNVWYRLDSSNGAFSARAYGQSGDVPSPYSVQPQ